MILKENIKTIYKDSDKRIIEFLENIVVGMGGSVPDYMKTNLDLLNTQLDIYFRAEDILKNSDLIVKMNKIDSQHPALNIMQKAHNNIMDIMKDSGITKASKARIDKMKRSDNTEDTDRLIEMLTA